MGNDSVQCKAAMRTAVYLRAVMIARCETPPLAEAKVVFGRKAHAIGEFLLGDRRVVHCFLRILADTSKVPIPPFLRRKRGVDGSRERFTYEPYVCELDLPGGMHGLLVASPTPALFPYMFRPEDESFYRFDLRALCDHQFHEASDDPVRMARLNGKIADKKQHVSGATLYGRDVTLSPILLAMVKPRSEETRREDIHPFTPPTDEGGGELLHHWFDPLACRLVWTRGAEPVALNVDRFGNLSFFLRDGSSLREICSILDYICRTKSPETTANPLERSEDALKEAER